MDEKTQEIVAELRAISPETYGMTDRAASLIESLSERVGELERERQKLRGALKPLDAAYDIWVGHPDSMPLKIARIGPGDDADLTMADLCEARALSKQGEGS